MTTQIPQDLLRRLSEFVEAQLGLSYPPGRRHDLDRALGAAARQRDCSAPKDFAREILSGTADSESLAALAEHLTIGETYFFREQASFQALERNILPPLIQARRLSGRRLRFWSAGCCSGEEPYSLAILLCRLLPDLETWEITLRATDINDRFLEKAAAGVYTEWSFRNAPSWLKRDYFTEIAEGRWEILPRIKEMVRFSRLNLATDPYPSRSNDTQDLDVILCRNVLIYMSPAQAKRMIGSFYDALADGGWLSVSPAETSNALLLPFRPVSLSGTTLYQKITAPATAAQARPLPNLSEPNVTPADAGREQGPAAALATHEDFAGRARACADAGLLEEALSWCDRAIAHNKVDPRSHYLRATIIQEQGELEEVARSFRTALLLDADFVLAHFALGSLAWRQGREQEAEKHLRRALDLLNRCEADSLVPESEGIAVSQLAAMIEAMLLREDKR